MPTIIDSNGSKWNGQAPDTIADLLQVLATHALDPTFEAYGNFIDTDPRCARHLGCDKYEKLGPIYPDMPGAVQFWGNFADLSHVFRIGTNDPDVIAELTAAIRANQATPAYAAAKAEILAREEIAQRSQIERHARMHADALARAASYRR